MKLSEAGALLQVKASEYLYAKELKQRKEVEETLTKERLELEKLKTQHNKILEELRKASEKKVQMELQIAESGKTVKDFQEKFSATKNLLISLQKEYKELQQSPEDAIREAEELHQTREEAATSTQGVMNFTEFTYSELEKATNRFDDSMKIGEGEYGSVYKGFLRHTLVAIKLLDSQSMQGQTEFYQEVKSIILLHLQLKARITVFFTGFKFLSTSLTLCKIFKRENFKEYFSTYVGLARIHFLKRYVILSFTFFPTAIIHAVNFIVHAHQDTAHI